MKQNLAFSRRRVILPALMCAVAGSAGLFILLGATPAHACAAGGNYNFNSNTNVNVNSNSNGNSNSTSVTIRHSVSG